VEYLERDSTYVEALIRGIRGWVIPGGVQWEKVQICFLASVAEGNKRNMRIVVDGMLAPGIGERTPPDSKFTYSMEPQYAENVHQFARSILDQLLVTIDRDLPK
jgi:hypothetical protein